MKIAILYIATGRYICFWEEFYKSAKEYLFKGNEVDFFVYTDSLEFPYCNNSDVKKIYYESLKWPEAGLLKYDTILKAKEELNEYDYMFYFNANMKFVAPIGEEILPRVENDNLAICEWASYYNDRNNLEFPYDRNPECWASIKPGEGKYYLMAGLHGGKKDEYIKMCEFLNQKTKEDMQKGVIASHHDESYINKYMIDKNPLIISPEYAMPLKWKIKGCENIKAIIQKKHHYKWGGHAYLRGATDKKITIVKWWLNKVFGTKFI